MYLLLNNTQVVTHTNTHVHTHEYTYTTYNDLQLFSFNNWECNVSQWLFSLHTCGDNGHP